MLAERGLRRAPACARCQAWSLLWPGAPAGAYATRGAAAFIGAATQAPLTGLVLVLTHNGVDLLVR